MITIKKKKIRKKNLALLKNTIEELESRKMGTFFISSIKSGICNNIIV